MPFNRRQKGSNSDLHGHPKIAEGKTRQYSVIWDSVTKHKFNDPSSNAQKLKGWVLWSGAKIVNSKKSGQVTKVRRSRVSTAGNGLTHGETWCRKPRHRKKNLLFHGGCETSRQEQIKNEPAVCASLLGSAHPLAMTRIQWADQEGQARGSWQK